MSKERTTLADVARATGVSVATVSKVLNDRADVAEHTRSRVLQELRSTAYRPVGSNRDRRQTLRPIEVLLPDPRSSYSIEVLSGIIESAHASGFDVVIGPATAAQRYGQPNSDPGEFQRAGRVGAIAITTSIPPSSGELDEDVPMVFVDPVHRGDERRVSVGATNFAGGVLATEHLLSLGHRRIGHAAGPADVDCSRARLAGYSSALREAGIALDENIVTHSTFEYEAGRQAASELLDRDDPPTAIFAGNDEIALGVMEEARRRSIRVPQDLSVVGFDNTFMATRSAPQLTTVAQPLFEMGAVAVRTLARLVDGEPVDSHHIELATRLTVRDSASRVRTLNS